MGFAVDTMSMDRVPFQDGRTYGCWLCCNAAPPSAPQGRRGEGGGCRQLCAGLASDRRKTGRPQVHVMPPRDRVSPFWLVTFKVPSYDPARRFPSLFCAVYLNDIVVFCTDCILSSTTAAAFVTVAGVVFHGPPFLALNSL